jgi:hypothetical protein
MSAASQREVQRSMPPPRSAPGKKSQTAALVAILIILCLLGLGTAMVFHRIMSTNPMGGLANAMGGMPPSFPPLASSSGQQPAFRDPTGGMFQERAGQNEMPTIFVLNTEEGILTLVLRDQAGRSYQAVSPAGQRTELKVPPGHYTVAVSSNVPGIQSNYGDATFRPFKEYDATFGYVSEAAPIHLGD